MVRSGGCLCGKVRFTATLKGNGVGACHCNMCRKWAGGPFLAIATAAVDFETPPATYTSSHWAERGFCPDCGSSLFYRLTAGESAGLVILSAGSLDDWDGLALDHEVFVDERPGAYCFAGDLPGKTGAELMGG